MTTTRRPINRPWRRAWDVIIYGLGQLRTVDKLYPGIMHLLIFWGVIIQVIGTAIKIMQMGLFVPFTWPLFSRPVYFGYELIMDLAGIAILVGVLMAAARRLFFQPSYLKTSWDDVYVLILLFLMPVVGFLNESLRLHLNQPAWADWSPVGAWLARMLPAIGLENQTAELIHPYFFWAHVGLGLVFTGSIPFTKLRHLFATPIHIFFKTDRSPGELETIEDLMESEVLGAGAVEDFSSRDLLSFDACLQCGRCEEVCPATLAGMAYSPRELLLTLRDEMAANLMEANQNSGRGLQPGLRSEEFLWACTTCGACLDVCPAFIRPPEQVVDIRRAQVLMSGEMPGMIAETLRSYERQGNPWGMPPGSRTAWMEGLEIPVLTPEDEVEVLFFVGCAGAYDDRNQKVTRAFISLLEALEVSYGVLGDREVCCGETARRMGNEYLFQMFAEENINLLNSLTFQKIVTLCPHGMNTLKEEYPRLGGKYAVQHGTEFLFQRLQEADLALHLDAPLGNLTVHDSCYLGRYQDIYEPPRDLLRLVGQECREMNASHHNSFCCGGGGGAMWIETDPETRINQHRLNQALEIDAAAISTACPYCLIMLDDAIRSRGMTDSIQVLDVIEILAQALK